MINWIFYSILFIVLGYIILRVFSKAMFKSFFEAKSECSNMKGGTENNRGENRNYHT